MPCVLGSMRCVLAPQLSARVVAPPTRSAKHPAQISALPSSCVADFAGVLGGDAVNTIRIHPSTRPTMATESDTVALGFIGALYPGRNDRS